MVQSSNGRGITVINASLTFRMNLRVLLKTAVPEFCPCALLSQLAGIFFSPNGDRTGTAVLSSPEKSSKTNGVKTC